jgi:hypothetical protein
LVLLVSLVFLVLFPEKADIANANEEGTADSPALTAPMSVPPPSQVDDQPLADDRACRLCHADTEAVITFPSGETLPVQVDRETLSGSAHGLHLETPLACTSCHAPADYQFPHAPVEAADLQAYRLARTGTCQ